MSIQIIKKFLGKIFYVYSASIVNGLLGIVLIRYMVGKLGFGGYGIYSVYTIGQSYLLLLDSSVSRSLVRKFIDEEDNKQTFEDHLSAFIIISTILIILLPLLYIWVYFTHAETLIWTVIGIVSVIILEFIGNIIISLRQSYQIATEDFKTISIFALLSGLIRYFLIFLVLFLDKTVFWVIASMLLKKIVEICLAYRIYKLPFDWNIKGFRVRRGITVLRDSIVITLAQISQTALITIPAIVAGRVLGIEGLGIFRSMFDLASRVWFLSNGLGLILFPLFAKLRTRIDVQVLRSLAFVNSVSFFGYFSLLIVGVIFSKDFAQFLRLDIKLSSIIVVVMVGMFINAHSNMMYELMQSFGRPVFVVLSALVAFSPYLLFTTHSGWDVNMVALIWSISQFLFLIVLDLFYLRIFGISKYTLMKIFGTIVGCICFVLIFYHESGQGLTLIILLSILAVFLLSFALNYRNFEGKGRPI